MSAHPEPPSTEDLIREAVTKHDPIPWYWRYGFTAPLVGVLVSLAVLSVLDAWLRRQHLPGSSSYGMVSLADREPTGFLVAVRAWSQFPGARWTATAHTLVDTLFFVPSYVLVFLVALKRGLSRLGLWLDRPTRTSLLVWRRIGRPKAELFLKSELSSQVDEACIEIHNNPWLRRLVAVSHGAVVVVFVLAGLDVAENLSSLALVNAFWQSTSRAVADPYKAMARVVWVASFGKWVLVGVVLLALLLLWLTVIQAEEQVQEGPPQSSDEERGKSKVTWWQVAVRWFIGGSTRQVWTRPERMTKTEGGLEGSEFREGVLPEPREVRIGVSCSGGGIRSASYNLGALQTLRTRSDVWKGDAILSAVSGGGYIAASHFIVAGKSRNPLPQPPGRPLRVFAPGSPEERYLRNHSSYLSPNLKSKLDLALNVLHGIGMNLLLLTAWIIVVGRPLGWLLASSWQPGLRISGGTDIGVVRLQAWMWWTPMLFVAGTLSTVFFERAAARFGRAPQSLVAFLRSWAWRLIILAVVSSLVLIAIPYAILLVRKLTSPNFSWTVYLDRVLSIPEQTSKQLLPILVAVVGLVGSAYRLLTAKKFSWIVRLGAYVFGPLLVFSMVVLWVNGAAAKGFHADGFRLWAGGIAVALVLGLLADCNLWSMHPFYKERLSSAFALLRAGPDEASEYPRELPIRFSTVTPAGWPTLVICAALNVREEGIAPPGRAASPFTFTSKMTGGPLTDYMPTDVLERWVPHEAMTLPAIMATSGAALAPNMGKMTRSSLRLLMSLANVRLGIWIPNPLRKDRMKGREPAPNTLVWLWRSAYDLGRGPGPLYLFYETLGVTHLGRRYIYVTDGGHFENLGLVELLRRGCTRVYTFDASGDAIDTFHTLGEAIALARSELQVEIDIDVDPMRPRRRDDTIGPCREPKADKKTELNPCQDPNVFSGDDHAIGTITYPNGVRGDFVFAKAAVVEHAPHDVLSYRDKDPVFPCHPTTDQLFEDEKFEAYRKLGAFTAQRAAEALDVLIAKRGSQLPAPVSSSNSGSP